MWNAQTDPTIACLLSSNVLSSLETIEGDKWIAEATTWVMTQMNNLWIEITGPNSWLGEGVKWVTTQIEDAIATWMPKLADFDTTVGRYVARWCKMAEKQFYGWYKAQEIPPQICDAIEAIEGGGLTPKQELEAIITGVLSWLADYLTAKINQYVWNPLITKMIALVGTSQSLIAQGILAICGIAPQVGGAICSAITAPVSSIATYLISVLQHRSLWPMHQPPLRS